MKIKHKISVGDIFKLNEGGTVEVIECKSYTQVKVLFKEGHSKYVSAGALRSGSVKNRFAPSLFGVCYLGDSTLKRSSIIRTKWEYMAQRVYSPRGNTIEAYAGCSISPEWYCLTDFERWFNLQQYEDGYQLDKDLLIKGNRVYSPTTCLMIPGEMNNFLVKGEMRRGQYPIGVSYRKSTGKFAAECHINLKPTYLGAYSTPEIAFEVYKEAKEKEAKSLALKWTGRVDQRAIDALNNFTVDITD